MFITTLFSSSYSIYYELTHENIHFVKHIANIIGFLTGPLGLILLKSLKRLNLTLFIMQAISISLVFTSTFFSGGIFSVDLMWMIVITIISFLFNGIKEGFYIMLLAMLFILIFYKMDIDGLREFESDSMQLGSGYKLYNLIFILLLASGITYFFVNGIQKIKSDLDEIKERHLKSLDYKYKYITDNANEIIGLHTSSGYCTFISAGLKNILGFEPEEMLGNKYALLIGNSFKNRRLECLTKTGNTVWLEITFNTIIDEVGNNEVYISMARNVTDKVLEDQKIAILRQQIANDFHDEMGNKLASITLNSTILALHTQENIELSNTIAKIEKTSKALYEHSRDFIWSIDSKSDELHEIFIYLKDFSEDFLESFSIKLSIESNIFEKNDKIILSAYSGRHIVLIVKEVLTNAVKHAKCNELFLSLIIDEHSFKITVKDNGIGIKQDEKSGKGLKSIQQRAKTIDCDLEIKTSTAGTEIILIGKLPKLGDRNTSFIS